MSSESKLLEVKYDKENCFTTVADYLWESNPEKFVELKNLFGRKTDKVTIVKD